MTTDTRTHTPRPWRVGLSEHRGHGRVVGYFEGTLFKLIARTWEPGIGFGHEESEANAHLIAAAPTMLAALEEAERAALFHAQECATWDEISERECNCYLSRVHAAIARARGEEG